MRLKAQVAGRFINRRAGEQQRPAADNRFVERQGLPTLIGRAGHNTGRPGLIVGARVFINRHVTTAGEARRIIDRGNLNLETNRVTDIVIRRHIRATVLQLYRNTDRAVGIKSRGKVQRSVGGNHRSAGQQSSATIHGNNEIQALGYFINSRRRPWPHSRSPGLAIEPRVLSHRNRGSTRRKLRRIIDRGDADRCRFGDNLRDTQQGTAVDILADRDATVIQRDCEWNCAIDIGIRGKGDIIEERQRQICIRNRRRNRQHIRSRSLNISRRTTIGILRGSRERTRTGRNGERHRKRTSACRRIRVAHAHAIQRVRGTIFVEGSKDRWYRERGRIVDRLEVNGGIGKGTIGIQAVIDREAQEAIAGGRPVTRGILIGDGLQHLLEFSQRCRPLQRQQAGRLAIADSDAERPGQGIVPVQPFHRAIGRRSRCGRIIGAYDKLHRRPFQSCIIGIGDRQRRRNSSGNRCLLFRIGQRGIDAGIGAVEVDDRVLVGDDGQETIGRSIKTRLERIGSSRQIR